MDARTPDRYLDFCSSTVFAARSSRVLLKARRAPCWLDVTGVRAPARAAARHCALGSWDWMRGERAESSRLLGTEGFGIVDCDVLRRAWLETLDFDAAVVAIVEWWSGTFLSYWLVRV